MLSKEEKEEGIAMKDITVAKMSRISKNLHEQERKKTLMKALNLDNQKDGCYVNIKGRNQLWGKEYFYLFLFMFMTINLIEFDYQRSYPLDN